MVLILPAAIAILFVLLQSTDCGEIRNGQIPFTCTSVGLATIKVAMATILFPPIIKFLQLFKRILNSAEYSEEKDEALRPKISEKTFEAGSQRLGMGQVLLAGNIEQVSSNSHVAQVNGELVRFVSIFPFQKGQLKPGDFVHLVYQNLLLLKNAKTVLAYSDRTAHNAFGASAWIYSIWVLLLTVCIVIFEILKPPYRDAMLGLSGALLVLDLAYLSLMFRARSRLRSHLDGEANRIDASRKP